MNFALPDVQAEFEDRLRFEMLLTELSARFVSVTTESIDGEIVNALRDGADIKGTTTRTAIFRLKEADIIRNEDGKWYLNEALLPEEEEFAS